MNTLHKRIEGAIALCVLTLFCSRAALAQTTWQVGSGNWSVAGNWDAGLPTSTQANIDNTGTATVNDTQATKQFWLAQNSGGNGGNPQGNVDIVTGGTLNTTSGSTPNYVGIRKSTLTSTLTVNGGTLNMGTASTSNYLSIAEENESNGAVILNSGVITSAGVIYVGGFGATNPTPGATGALTLNGGTLTVSNNGIQAGINNGSQGTFTVAGGAATHNVTGDILFGVNSGATGIFSMSNGTLADAGIIKLGVSGTGNATVSGGTLSANNLQFGTAAGGNGNMTVSGATTSVTSNGTVQIGFNATGTGNLTLNGGTMTVTAGGMNIGRNSPGSPSTNTLTMGGGTLSFSSAQAVNVGTTTGASGTIFLNSGSMGTQGILTVGSSGTGTVTGTGGTLSADNGIVVGANSTSTGNLMTIGGTSQVTSGSKMTIGNSGSGTVTLQNTAQLNITATGLVVGSSSAGNVLNLNGGTLTVSGGGMTVGENNASVGTLNVTAGAAQHNVTGNVLIGKNVDSTGQMNLSGGTFGVTSGIVNVGNQGAGDLTVSGGVLKAYGGLRLASGTATGTGALTVQGNAGAINVKGGTLYIGDDGAATLNEQIGASGVSAINIFGNVNAAPGIALNPSSSAALNVSLTAAPPTGNLVLINNASGFSSILGSGFTGLAEGALISASFNSITYQWNLTYQYNFDFAHGNLLPTSADFPGDPSAWGNDNLANDVALIAVTPTPEPSAFVLGIFGLALMTAIVRKKRLSLQPTWLVSTYEPSRNVR